MDHTSLTTQIFAFWLVCGFVGAIIGSAKQSGFAGFLLGLILGPLGLLAAFMVDGRAKCPTCAGRLHSGSRLCHHCGQPIADPASQLQRAESDDLTREEEAAKKLRRKGGLPPREG